MSDDNFEIEVPSVSTEVQQKLEDASGDKKIRHLRFMAQETAEYLKLVREQVKDVENFWAFSLLSHVVLKEACSAKADRQALTYLTDVELIQDPKDPRPFEIVFHFKENPFFSNASLSKKYTLGDNAGKPGEDGAITKEMRDFAAEDLNCSAISIDWKDNLCEKYPRKKLDADSDLFEGDAGSFFHYFTDASDPYSIGVVLQQDLLPDVYDYFRGEGENCDAGDDFSDEEDELDEEDDEDNDEEIDLEEEEAKPKKKQRTQ